MTGVHSPVRPGTRASYLGDLDLVTRSVVASTLIGSAVVHGTVAGEHFGEWFLAGAFFIAVQAVELVLALLAVYAWTRGAAVLVIASGVLTLSVWLLSRTLGMPFGPADFRVPEAVGVPDAACLLLEVMSVLAAAAALPLLPPRGTRPPTSAATASRRGRLVAGTAAWAALVLTIWGGVPTVLGADAHSHGSQAEVPAP